MGSVRSVERSERASKKRRQAVCWMSPIIRLLASRSEVSKSFRLFLDATLKSSLLSAQAALGALVKNSLSAIAPWADSNFAMQSARSRDKDRWRSFPPDFLLFLGAPGLCHGLRDSSVTSNFGEAPILDYPDNDSSQDSSVTHGLFCFRYSGALKDS